MDGKEAIIEKIISDAKSKAMDIEKSANDYAKEKLEDANFWVESFNKAEEDKLQIDVNDIIERRKIIANLDVRKLRLDMKQNLISDIFEKVYVKLCSLSKNDYLRFVEKLLIKYASNGDLVILSKDGVLSSESIKSLKIFNERQLKISNVLGDFIGGVYLTCEKCDKDLSFKSIINEIKKSKTLEISSKLF